MLSKFSPRQIIIFKQVDGKKNTGLLIAVYVVFTTSVTTAFLIIWPGTIMWEEVMFVQSDPSGLL